jgi:hypothetical protein
VFATALVEIAYSISFGTVWSAMPGTWVVSRL